MRSASKEQLAREHRMFVSERTDVTCETDMGWDVDDAALSEIIEDAFIAGWEAREAAE